MVRKRYHDDNEDDDKDDYNNPFDFMNFFSDPNKFFRSKKFQQLFKDIFEKILQNLPPEFQGLSPEDITKELKKSKFGFKFSPGPFMAGFNIRFGPNGRPIIDSFGNIKTRPFTGEPKVDEVREPLVEVSEEEEHLIVIAEMPGVSKEDIELKATTNSLTISSKSENIGRKYYKEIDLPTAINSNYAKARYQNGILEVKLKKINEKSTNIKID
ncbi:MAG: archaeal heat shock protein Hsp20 [Promethearchaeota archaeon]